ncbi:hypothetical protein [Pseudomonas vanderleydeniana]|uniref:Uncharacterized protein n=1 Tax=Pseudomonas vanderleydeniana TaxID=2745495 RepID=A0A9E6TQB2_9PSED|nr:hypothetical protein [Pseudomonas vanderleydeniana]QXI26336.1 hypothetical protein HU752_020580 [Pseudomonas vanderleydeniana]
MYSQPRHYPPGASKRFALEQNQRLFDKAFALQHAAYEMLERSDLDAETFSHYQALKTKAHNQAREAIEHLQLVDRDIA